MKPKLFCSRVCVVLCISFLFLTQKASTQSVTISGPSTVATGSQETYTANFTYSVDPYSIIYWSVTGGTIISQNVNPSNPPVFCTVQWDSSPGTGTISIYEDLNSGEAQRNVDIICGEADGGPNRIICLGGSATIGVPAIAGFSYSWSPTTGLSNPSIAQPIASPGSTTTYTVTMSANGCTATQTTVTVTVNPLPTISPSGPITKCTQYETGPWLTLSTNLSNNIQWRENGTNITGENSSNITLHNNPSAGVGFPTCTGNITVVNTQTGCVSNQVVVTRKNFYAPQVYLEYSGGCTCSYDTPEEYCASVGGLIKQTPSSNSGAIYYWNVFDPFNNPASGITISPNNTSNPTATIDFSGYSYNTAIIHARAIDNGCDGATDNDWNQIYTITIDHTCRVASSSLKKKLDEKTITIFPNPANSFITVKSENPIVEVEILDINRVLSYVKKKTGKTSTTVLDVSNLRSGIYLCKVVTTAKTEFLKLRINPH